MIELEVLAKKFDRFGWERDRETAAQDGMILDWMDALQDYPVPEVRAACREAVLNNPNKMPNEGHVKAQIIKARAKAVVKRDEPNIATHRPSEREKNKVSQMLVDAGFAPNRFGGDA